MVGDLVMRLRLAAAAGDLHGPGLILAALCLAGLLATVALLAIAPNAAPAQRAYGTVLTVDVSAGNSGPQIVARVRTADGERTLFLASGATCWPGDRIELARRGKRYTAGAGGCTRP